MSEKIRVTTQGLRAVMEEWLAEGRGIAAWDDLDTSSPEAGLVFTAGDAAPPEDWSVRFFEYYDSLDDFEFVELIDVKRFKVTMEAGGKGTRAHLSNDSLRRVRLEMKELAWRTARRVFYKVDYSSQEAVIAVSDSFATVH